jgi:protein TonB
VGSLGPEWASPQPLGQTSTRIQIKDLTPWADQVLEKIEKNWIFDPARSQGIKGTVGISVTVTKSGEIISIEVSKSSGNPTLDSFAKNAVEMSVPLPSLPIMYPSNSIVFTIEFEYDE